MDPLYKILCIDDDSLSLTAMRGTVTSLGFSCIEVTDPKLVAEILNQQSKEIVLILSDYKMPGLNGIELRKTLLEKYADIPFAIVSSMVSKELALEGIDAKISAFIGKPVLKEKLSEVINKDVKPRINSLQEEREVIESFVVEAGEHLNEIEEIILELEGSSNRQESLNRVYALAHTIKGTSSFFQPDSIHRFTHEFENYLEKIRSGRLQVNDRTITVMLKGFDVIKSLIGKLRNHDYTATDIKPLTSIFEIQESPQTCSSDQANVISASKKAIEEIKVASYLLDQFMELSGEVTVIRNMSNKIFRTLEKKFAATKEVHQLGELLEEMHRINGSMQDKIIDLRKVSLRNIFRPLPRAVRDLSRTLQKEVRIDFIGDELRVDTKLAEALSGSIIHMVRNCVDHGIESIDERKSKGKPGHGTITITCAESKETISVEISDDGRGIDCEKIKMLAIKKGLYSPDQLASAPAARIYDILFEPGFSTAEKVTEISGRGVGMDMVKKSVNHIGGLIETKSTIGKGTIFSLKLPVPTSVLITPSLMVEVGRKVFAIPQDKIAHLLTLGNDEIKTRILPLEGTKVIDLDGEILPLVALRDVFKNKENFGGVGELLNVVIVNSNDRRFGLIVDKILDLEDTVVKPLHKLFQQLGAYSGSTFLDDGSVGLILDIDGIADLAQIKTKSNSTQKQNISKSPISKQRYIVFEMHASQLAVDLSQVSRLEVIDSRRVSVSGNQTSLVYNEKVIPVINFDNSTPNDTQPLIIIKSAETLMAIAVSRICDLIESEMPIDSSVVSLPFAIGTIQIAERTVTVVDIHKLALRDKTIFPRQGNLRLVG